MANQLNSARGLNLKALKTGQVVLTKVIRTSNPDIVSLELYEGGIVNTSRASAWQNITVSNLELMLGIDELDIDNGMWEEFRTKAGKVKEMLELNILDPIAVYNPQLNEECNIRFRAVIVENTVISKDKFKWAEDKLNIFDKEDQIEAIVKQYAKRPGADKPAITHNGSVVYRDVKVSKFISV